MKNALFILLLLPVIAFSQESKEPFKKANTIIIPIDEPEEQAYKKIARIFTSNGYGIENSDNILLILSSTEKGMRYGTVKLNASIEEEIIRITGTYTTIAVPGSSNIDYRGMKGSPARDAWEEMQKVASQYKKDLLYAAN